MKNNIIFFIFCTKPATPKANNVKIIGKVNSAIAREAAAAGYSAAFSLYPPGHNGRIDRYALRRDGVYIIDTRGTLEIKLGRGPLFWLEDIKGRAINAVSVLTPLLKRY